MNCSQSLLMLVFGSYQPYAAQHNDDVDEELEVCVLYDAETRLPAVEATLPGSLRRVHIQDGTATVTA